MHRSASTGKQANKALALHTAPNHPHAGASGHPRPILPKPLSTSNLSVPKSVNGSRVPSPGGLREPGSSTHPSRDVSPAMLPQQMQLPSHQQSFQLSDSTASGGVSAGMALYNPALSDFGSESSHTTNASSDPNLDPGLPELSDEAILAFINQFTAEGTAYSDQAPSSESSLDPALATPEPNFEQGRPFENYTRGDPAIGSAGTGGDDGGMDPEFLAMLTSAINSAGQPSSQSLQAQQAQHQQQQQQQQQPQHGQQQSLQPHPQPTQHAFSHQQHTAVTPSLFPEPYSLSSSLTFGLQAPSSIERGQTTASQLGLRSNLDLSVPPSQSNANIGLSVSLAEYLAAQQSQAHQQPSDPEPIYRQLPPQSTAFLQQVLGQNPSFPAGPNGIDHGAGSSGHGLPSSNGNMIDLSKPLNSSDVERILRALQDQQAAQARQAAQNGQSSTAQKYQPQPQSMQQRPHSQSGSRGLVQSDPVQTNGLGHRLSNPDFQFGHGTGFGPMAYGSQELMNRYMMSNGMGTGQSQDAMGMTMPIPVSAGGGDVNAILGYGAPGMPDMADMDGMAGGWNGMWTAQAENPHAGQGLVDAMKRGAGV